MIRKRAGPGATLQPTYPMIANPRSKPSTNHIPSRPRTDGHSREFSGDTRPRQSREEYPSDDSAAPNSLGERTPANAAAAPSRLEYQPFDTDDEEAYWESAHSDQPFAGADDYEKYAPAYRTGFEGFERLGAEYSFDDVEEDLQEEYEAEGSSMPWERAREASRAAWDRLEGRLTDSANEAGMTLA